MKVSELTRDDVIAFIRLEGTEPEIPPEMLLAAAKAYVKGYTRLTDEEIDLHEDITLAVLVLCSDMYDNRQMQVEGDKVNRVVSSILDLHQRVLVG